MTNAVLSQPCYAGTSGTLQGRSTASTGTTLQPPQPDTAGHGAAGQPDFKVILFQNKTHFTRSPPPTHAPTRAQRSVPRNSALPPGTEVHSHGHIACTTAALGESPTTSLESFQALGVPFGADTGLRFLPLCLLQPCSSPSCNHLLMKSSVTPHLHSVLCFSLGKSLLTVVS